MSAAIGRRSPPDCSVLTVPVRETGGAQSCIPFLAGLTQSTCALIAVRQAIQNRDDLLSVTFDDIAGDRARIVVECIGVKEGQEILKRFIQRQRVVLSTSNSSATRARLPSCLSRTRSRVSLLGR